jgi:hypothetical protein
MLPDPQISVDVEKLMNRIQHLMDAQPDSAALLESVNDCRRHADGISEFNGFSRDPISRTKFFFYKCVMRSLKGNFERQRLFNHLLVNNLQLVAEELDKIQQRLPTKDDDKTGSL